MNETLTRTLSGIVYIVILISATLYSNSFLLLFGALLLLLVLEFCDLVQLQKIIPLGIAALTYFWFSYFNSTREIDLLLLIISLFTAVKAMVLLFGKGQNKVDSASKYIYLLGYIIFPVILITKLPSATGIFTPSIIISIFVLIWINDTMAYVVGKTIGKHKLFERISPKKTMEGFVGGVVFSMLFSILIAYYFIQQPIIYWVIIATIVGVFGTIGDLVESKLKRLANVKDSGKIMPGHGGILDRLDSIIFVGPFVFLFYQIIAYVS